MIAFLVFAMVTASRVDEAYRSFGDWVSVCDNGLRCQVSSAMGQAANISVHMHLRREAGPRSPINVSFVSSSGWRQGRGQVLIDGRTFGLARQGSRLEVPAALALAVARAVANGRSIEVLADGERFPVSAQGSAAALRHIDARQGRAGTVTAIVARGAAPASSVPPPPALPLRTEMRRPRRGLIIRPSAQRLAAWRRAQGCDARLDPGHYPPESWPIDRRRAVILVMCYPGNHNSYVLVKVGMRADGRDARSAIFDVDASLAERSGPTVPPDNASRDETTDRLVSGQRGAIAYPTIREEWVWDGNRFRLVERSGSYGSSFRARVRQR